MVVRIEINLLGREVGADANDVAPIRSEAPLRLGVAAFGRVVFASDRKAVLSEESPQKSADPLVVGRRSAIRFGVSTRCNKGNRFGVQKINADAGAKRLGDEEVVFVYEFLEFAVFGKSACPRLALAGATDMVVGPIVGFEKFFSFQ